LPALIRAINRNVDSPFLYGHVSRFHVSRFPLPKRRCSALGRGTSASFTRSESSSCNVPGLRAPVLELPLWEHVRKNFGIDADLENVRKAMELY